MLIRHLQTTETWDKSYLAEACGTVTVGTKQNTVPSNYSHKPLQDETRPRFLLVFKVANLLQL